MGFFEGYAKDINRLITSLHPTGKVVFQDDFEGATLKWREMDATIARSTTKALSGTASMSLTTPATAESVARGQIGFGYPGVRKFGVELNTLLPYGDDFLAFEFYLWILDGSLQLEWATDLYYNSVNSQYELRVYDGSWHVIDTVTAYFNALTTPYFWFNWKLIGDADAKKYESVFFAGKLYDLKAQGCYDPGATTRKEMSLCVEQFTRNDASVVAYVDDVTITAEP